MTRDTKRGSGRGTGLARAAVALGVLLAGCAGTQTYDYKKTPVVFTVHFKGKCPDTADVDFQNCTPKRVDCAHVRRGEFVTFRSDPPDNAFVLQFDPFGESKIEVKGERTLTTQMNEKGGKPYTFTIRSALDGCPKVIDPELILD